MPRIISFPRASPPASVPEPDVAAVQVAPRRETQVARAWPRQEPSAPLAASARRSRVRQAAASAEPPDARDVLAAARWCALAPCPGAAAHCVAALAQPAWP